MTRHPTGSLRLGRKIAALTRRRGITQMALATKLGVSNSAVTTWVRGTSLPRPATAGRLVELFDSKHLAEILEEVSTLTCVQCGAPFRHRTAKRGRFCRHECWARYWNQYKVQQRSGDRADLLVSVRNENDELRFILRQHENVLAAWCRQCSQSLCRTPECEWRSLSPLPLAEEQAA